jgi:hypothetical protein
MTVFVPKWQAFEIPAFFLVDLISSAMQHLVVCYKLTSVSEECTASTVSGARKEQAENLLSSLVYYLILKTEQYISLKCC